MEIIVIGYPRSGNTWLSRLLGDALNCPVTGIGTAKPLAEEGQDRDSPHVVRQLHMKPTSIRFSNDRPMEAWSDKAVDCAYWYGIELHNPKEQYPVLIVRDPRDVSVSAAHYWQRDSLQQMLEAMVNGTHPLKQIGSWQEYMRRWLKCSFDLPVVKYEQLNANTVGTLSTLLKTIGLVEINHLSEVVRRQSFRSRREQLINEGDSHPYGKTIQLRNLRKGIVGDWKNEYTYHHGYYVDPYWSTLLMTLGYERSSDWYAKLPR